MYYIQHMNICVKFYCLIALYYLKHILFLDDILLASLDFKLSVTESVIAWFCVGLRWLYNIFVFFYSFCEDIFGICVYLASRQKYELQ